jgi:hypothetical protein
MAKGKAKAEVVMISKETWEWARANPRYESLLEELEDLEDLRREKAKREMGVPFEEVVKEYERLHRVRLSR